MHVDENYFSHKDVDENPEQPRPFRPANGKRRPIALLVVVASIAACLALIGGSIGLSYLTDMKHVSNEFIMSTDGLDIALTEEHWDTADENDNGVPDASECLVPLQVIAKDPVLVNRSDMDVYMFMTVRVPVLTCSAEDVLYIGDDGMPASAKRIPIFKFGEAIEETGFSEGTSDKWLLYGQPAYSRDESGDSKQEYATFTYLYKDKVPSPKAGSEFSSTVPLFSSIQFANISERASYSPGSISIKGYAVQALGFDDDADMSAEGAQSGYMKAWHAYQRGDVTANEAKVLE